MKVSLWIVVLAVLFLNCSEKPVQVGAVLPLTGEHAVYGLSLRQGIEIAQAEVNRSGGILGRPLNLVLRDTGSSPQSATLQMRELIDREQVAAVLGGATSGETLAMAPLAESYHRILLSPSASSPLLTDAGEYVFRVWPSDLIEASVMADFAAYTLHALRVLVVSTENPYADGLRSAFAEHFAGSERKVDALVFPRQGGGWGGLAAQARNLGVKAHCLYVVGYENDLVEAIRAIRKEGLSIPILTVSAAANPGFPAKLGAQAESVLFPRPRFEPESTEEAVHRFVQAYKKRFGQEPDIYAAHGFDAAMVLASVMRTHGTRPESIQQGLLALRNYPGACGPITFDAKGDVVQPIQICVISHGKTQPLADVQDQVLPALQRKVEILRFGKR